MILKIKLFSELEASKEWFKNLKLVIYRMKITEETDSRLQNFIMTLAKSLKENEFLKEYLQKRGQDRLLEVRVRKNIFQFFRKL